MNKNLEYFILFCLLTSIIIITFFEVYTGQKMFASGDSLSPIAVKHAINNYYEINKQFPLWFPWILGGMPTIHSLLSISPTHSFFWNFRPNKFLNLFYYLFYVKTYLELNHF